MPTSKDLLLAILSMDSYNRGYGAGIELSDATDTKIGAATISKRIQDVSDTFGDTAQTAGFYAIAYDVAASGVEGIDADTTVISALKSFCGADQYTDDHVYDGLCP